MSQNSEPVFDLIIAGGGLTGATLALAAQEAGLDVCVLEARVPDPQVDAAFDGRATALAFTSFRMLRALGLGEALEPHASPMRRILVTDGRRPGAARGAAMSSFLRFEADEIDAQADGEPLGYLVENRILRAALNRALIERGIKVVAPVKVADVTVHDAHASVIAEDGRQLRARVIAGAEGRASKVRDCAGIRTIGWTYGQAGVVATVGLSRPHDDIAHEYFLPDGPFAILPLTGQRASLVWTESARRAQSLMATGEDGFMAHLNRRFGEFLGPVSLQGPRFSYPLSLSYAEHRTGARTALVGDAAQAVHPVAGQGLNIGLRDVASLVEVLAEAKRLGEDIGSAAVLERYARWRRFDSVVLAASFDGFVRLFSNDNPLLRVARGVGMSAVNRVPALRRAFMMQAGGALGDLPRLLRGERV
ncbi:MAG: UbiH/UbiF/VisC/COQ6 family ubiquinone biosynthesis hydroxylase [Brevundimonas sp.]|jgi:2-octaprenyl-6-methoxyphenol hydroxylase|uniref:UbiH/UbiF/VisC/COQ6 family ubiquinone biosynthesis hydroxylase n=1 Tax=Brevundimonas sp. TaxID=1871086 RepID=UPI00391C4280